MPFERGTGPGGAGGEQRAWGPLSGQSSWAPVHITGTNTSGAHTVHTAPNRGFDRVWVWANCTHTAAVLLSLEWTGAGVTKQLDFSITNDTRDDPVVDGWLLGGGATLKAFAATTAVINLVGYRLRYD